MFKPDFAIGSTVDNNTIMTNFKCKHVGGMRRSHRTNTLVIVADHTKSFYVDRWENDIIHYTGMGKKGDQELYYDQNRTIAESMVNGVDIHFFEVCIPKKYIYRGRVQLVGDPYEAIQKDSEQFERKVWIFPLQIISE